VCERYVNLLADFDGLSDDVIRRHRDKLANDLKFTYQFAPDTDSRAYREACAALKLNEEMTFSLEEIDDFLPPALRLGTKSQHKSVPNHKAN
jgi:hypothetical protein